MTNADKRLALTCYITYFLLHFSIVIHFSLITNFIHRFNFVRVQSQLDPKVEYFQRALSIESNLNKTRSSTSLSGNLKSSTPQISIPSVSTGFSL